MLNGKQIVLGVTGGIAAYKIPFLVRELSGRGATVRVVMTESATKFVSPLTLSTLSGVDAVVGMFPEPGSRGRSGTWHIDLAVKTDLLLIAPATANVLAKLAHGIADDAVSTLALAFRKEILICPAMDYDMWEHAATVRNTALLRDIGYDVMEPERGELASGLSGPGRLPEIVRIADTAEAILRGTRRDFAGVSILVTAGPTHEALDPVRYIGNRSSGKMGFAIARAAGRRGAAVTLVAGPVDLWTPRGVKRIDVESADQMRREVLRRARDCDALVMAAAVADFTPVDVQSEKIKKPPAGQGGMLTLELRQTRDILADLSTIPHRPKVVGFALETRDGAKNARAKLKAKQLDLIALNNPLQEGSAFGGDTNAVTIFWKTGRTEKLPTLPKFDVANALLDRLRTLLGKPKPQKSAAPGRRKKGR